MSNKRRLAVAFLAGAATWAAGFILGARIPLDVCGRMPCDIRAQMCLPCPPPAEYPVRETEE